jgi:hypothetical protein
MKPFIPPPINKINLKNLFHLIYKEDISEVLTLLDNNKDLIHKKYDGCSLIQYAARYGKLNLVKEFLNRGANINAYNKNGFNALCYASFWNHIEIVIFLLDRGAYPCNRAIQWVCDFAYYDICILLLRRGGDPLNNNYYIKKNILDEYGFFAQSRLYSEVIEIQKKNLFSEWNWIRRWPFLQIIFGHKFQYLEYSRKLLFASALPHSSSIPPIEINTPEKFRVFLISSVFGNLDLLQIIVSYI